MRYFPHTPEERAAMLERIGAGSMDELFSPVPEDCRRKRPMDLPPLMSEWELRGHLSDLAAENGCGPEWNIFIGAGSYEHYIPAVVSDLIGRSELYTAYTPYQPETAQGTLQALYEYQTMITRLLGLDIANASLYDGASALAESLLMAIRATGRKAAAVSRSVHPHYRQVVSTYLGHAGYEVIELPIAEDGTTDLSLLERRDDLAAVAVQSPNFFGCVEDLHTAAGKARSSGALLTAAFTEPLAYGLLKPPGSLGADIACGEGQSFGVPQCFGGPLLGVLAARREYLRSIPGRLVGKTLDREGRRGFVLTLATREQHIRREKATSNICTNNSLCAVAAAMYLASLGGSGLRELARLNHDKARYLKSRLEEAGFPAAFSAPVFNEFVIRAPSGFERIRERLLERRVVAGLPISRWYPELEDHYLFCATETKTAPAMDDLAREMAS